MKPLLLVILAIPLTACITIVVPPPPTQTPFPTYTPYPTYTPLTTTASVRVGETTPLPTATNTAPLVVSAGKCIAWTDAAAHMGETTCVRGTVYFTNKSGSAFFIDFDNTRTSFYGVSFTQTWDNLKGKCVEISGKISEYRGRPQMILERNEQLRFCQ